MKPLRLAVIGFGRIGKTCAEAILADPQLALAGIVRRAERVADPLPTALNKVPAVSHVGELSEVDTALVCVPSEHVLGVVHDVIQAGIPIVECAALHGEAFQDHKAAIDRVALRHKTPAIVGAGWDPGALSLFRNLFALLTPKGHTKVTRRPGMSLHHTTVARAVAGVKEALSTELRTSAGNTQRYVYVEPEKGVEFRAIEEAIQNDPQFLGEETLVFPVQSVAVLEEQGHGVLLERQGTTAAGIHQLFLLEGRFSESVLTAQVMLAGARALPTRSGRAYSLLDLPLGTLWGNLRAQMEKEWI